MEQDDDKKKKLNDDMVVFMRKRSETEAPRYTARLKTYVDIQQKHRRAAAARHHSEFGCTKTSTASRKKVDAEHKLPAENTEHPGNDKDHIMSKRGRMNEKDVRRGHSNSRSNSGGEPSDRCGRRRRSRRRRPRRTCCGRGCKRRRRRRSGRRRRRRRSRCCGKRRRRRSSRRRRRRRSCGRRRR